MITKVDLLSDQAISLPVLGVTPKTSILVKKITGLNPPDKSLFIGDYSQDGGLYQGRRVGNRNVVVTMDLNPNPALGETVASLRHRLYKAFNDPHPEGDFLKIRFYEDNNRITYVVGYCEKFENEVFDADTMCQASMICPDPYIRNEFDVVLERDTGWTKVPFEYEGTAETGFIVRINVTAQVPTITLENNGKRMQLSKPGSNYQIGDLIVINTIRGQRSITLTKPADLTMTPVEFAEGNSYGVGSLVWYQGIIYKAVSTLLGNGATQDMAPSVNNTYWDMVSTPIVSQLTSASKWLELHSVSNTMRIYGGDDVTSVVANIKYLQYTPSYWGL